MFLRRTPVYREITRIVVAGTPADRTPPTIPPNATEIEVSARVGYRIDVRCRRC